jgi:hypothetical protein
VRHVVHVNPDSVKSAIESLWKIKACEVCVAANNFGTFLGAVNVGTATAPAAPPAFSSASAGQLPSDMSSAVPTTAPPSAPTAAPVPNKAAPDPATTSIDSEGVAKQVVSLLTGNSLTIDVLLAYLKLQPEQLQPVLDYLREAQMIEIENEHPSPRVSLTNFASEALQVFTMA